jgi:hypothetical protein
MYESSTKTMTVPVYQIFCHIQAQSVSQLNTMKTNRSQKLPYPIKMPKNL